jgi:eukaryotic-like serine/threonine-protein kinase
MWAMRVAPVACHNQPVLQRDLMRNKDCVGQQIGNYRLIRFLGESSFAEVYLGEHVYLKRPAAIKVLRGRLVNDGMEGFLTEARAIASLEHPHIVRVLECGVEASTPFWS